MNNQELRNTLKSLYKQELGHTSQAKSIACPYPEGFSGRCRLSEFLAHALNCEACAHAIQGQEDALRKAPGSEGRVSNPVGTPAAPPWFLPAYTSGEVARICNVSLRQLQWWDRHDIVPAHHDGYQRWYYPEEVIEIGIISELRHKGFSLQQVRRVLRYLQQDTGKRLSQVYETTSELHLLTDGKTIYLEDAPNRIIDLLKSARQPMFLVCITDQLRRLTPPAIPPKSERTMARRTHAAGTRPR